MIAKKEKPANNTTKRNTQKQAKHTITNKAIKTVQKYINTNQQICKQTKNIIKNKFCTPEQQTNSPCHRFHNDDEQAHRTWPPAPG